MLKKWAICAALFATAAVAYADAKWEVVSQNPTATFYVDTESITRTGQTVNVWTKAVNSTPRIQSGDQIATAYGLDHFVFNCADKSGALVSFARFDQTGATIQSLARKKYEMEAVAPDTPMAILLHRVCQ
ncbi:hypothetical protein SAMN05443245_4373 [Paraburkholderia fungorum]|uniref:Surface-adhesin protein E-like domain-containing protein n=1 Tax=Paraburkholderia fungorum TaxID=134537 RepID=A0A1H1HWJ6_9BURK|nr:surface-adhesin E family protein [Paraburkholderia fungorum]SDR29805.1 hypothetical protein SAMN05443245_4373 [Paraburkholderia fungorum]